MTKKVMKCFLCESEKNIELHHLDYNHSNNEPINKVHLCSRCHAYVHNCLGISDMDELRTLKSQGITYPNYKENKRLHPPEMEDLL